MKKNIIEAIVKGILEEAGVSNEKILTKRITDKLIETEKSEAEKKLDPEEDYIKRMGAF